MNIPPCNKFGRPKNLHPCKKNYRRRRFPQNQKTFMKFYRQRSLEERMRGVNPAFADLFLNAEELQVWRAKKSTEQKLSASVKSPFGIFPYPM